MTFAPATAAQQEACSFVPKRSWRQAFTLIELLTVMGIIVVLMTLSVPAFNAIKGGNDIMSATYDLSDMLVQARTYAMAYNTYVFFGIVEVDSARAESSPQTVATSVAGGRLAIMTFASKNGMRGYNLSDVDPGTSWTTNYAVGNGAMLVPLTKLKHYDNVHLAKLPNPADGNMHRAVVSTTGALSYNVGDDTCQSVTPITYPLGRTSSQGQYRFTKIIYFDPQGVARIQDALDGDSINGYIEVGLQATHGNAVPTPPPDTAANQGQITAVQIDCMTGTVRIYKP